MRVIVTCGPSWEPLDEVRRLTNSSTGELGLMLSTALMRDGREVICMKGECASAQGDAGGAMVVPFSTNVDLLEKLVARVQWAGVIFHAAALCDFTMKTMRRADGTEISARKVPTADGDLSLTLAPAVKVLPQLRVHFPAARIVGWKYELDGSRDEALAKAAQQLSVCGTDACVVNGAAWGEGFGVVEQAGLIAELPDKAALCEWLVRWLR